MNGSEAGGDLAVWYRRLCLSHVNALVSIRTTWFTQPKQWGLYQNKVTSSLAAIHRPGHWAATVNCFHTIAHACQSRQALLICLQNSPFSLRLLGESGILDKSTLGPCPVPRTCCAIQTGLFVFASAYPMRANDPRYSTMTGSTAPTALRALTAGNKFLDPSSWTATKMILLW